MSEITYRTNVYSIFGGGYVPEQHNEELPRLFVEADIGETVAPLTASMFSELLHALRASLSINVRFETKETAN